MTNLGNNFAPLMPESFDQWSEVNVLGLIVKLDGQPYSATSANWTENAHGAGDTLTVTIPLSSNPDFPTQLFRGAADISPASLAIDIAAGFDSKAQLASEAAAANADVIIELWVGFPQSPTVAPTSISQLTRFFLGEVDKYSGKFGADTVTFNARSLAAHLIDDKLTTISTSQTVGQFLATQAKKYGLPTPVININPAATPSTIQQVLAYDQIGGSNFAASLYGMHPMDLAIRGAMVDDTDVWVDVRTGTIHYEFPLDIDRGTPIDLKWGRDWVELSPTHAPQFSKNVEVIAYAHQPNTRISTSVRVSDSGNGTVTTSVSSGVGTSQAILGTNQTLSTSTSTNLTTGSTSTSTSISSSSGGNTTSAATQGAGESATAKQRYPLYLGNVSRDQAVQQAQAYRRQITQHEYSIEGSVPITARLLQLLSITSLFRIHGNPWGLSNGVYYPRAIEYAASVAGGFQANIVALNHSIAQGGV